MATIELIYRKNRTVEPDKKYQADIWVNDVEEHHGIGYTPAEALFNAALHWRATELVTKDA